MRPNAWAQGTAPGARGASDEEGGPPPLCTGKRAAWGQGLSPGLGEECVFLGVQRVLFSGPEMMCVHFTGEALARPPLTLKGGADKPWAKPLRSFIPIPPHQFPSRSPRPPSCLRWHKYKTFH